MKRLISILLSVFLLFSLFSCETPAPFPDATDENSDTNYTESPPERINGFYSVNKKYLGIATSGVIFPVDAREEQGIVPYRQIDSKTYYIKETPTLAVIFYKVRTLRSPIIDFRFTVVNGAMQNIYDYRDSCDSIKMVFSFEGKRILVDMDTKTFWYNYVSSRPLIEGYDESKKTQTHFMVYGSDLNYSAQMQVELSDFPKTSNQTTEVQISIELYEGEQLLFTVSPAMFFLTENNTSYRLQGSDSVSAPPYYYYPGL